MGISDHHAFISVSVCTCSISDLHYSYYCWNISTQLSKGFMDQNMTCLKQNISITPKKDKGQRRKVTTKQNCTCWDKLIISRQAFPCLSRGMSPRVISSYCWDKISKCATQLRQKCMEINTCTFPFDVTLSNLGVEYFSQALYISN